MFRSKQIGQVQNMARTVEGPYKIDDPRFHRLFSDDMGDYDTSHRNGLTHSAVWKCVNFAVNKVADTPIYARKRLDDDGGSEIDRTHKAYRVLRRKASPTMVASEWKRAMMFHALYYSGNAFSYIKPSVGNQFAQLILMDPRKVVMYVLFDQVHTEQRILEAGTVIYEYNHQGVKYVLAQSDVFHIKGLSFNGIFGLPVYDYMRQAIGAGNVARDFAFRYFEKGAHPSFMVYYPRGLAKENEAKWLEAVKQATEGLGNSHTMFPLYNDAKVERLSDEPDKQQALEGREFSMREVCNYFGFHPSVVGLEDSQAYNSLEVSSELCIDSIDPWFCRFEDEAYEKLLTPKQKHDESHFFEFAREELRRTGHKTKVETLISELNNGGINHDQYCRIMKRPVSGHKNGGRYRMPANLTYLDAEPKTELDNPEPEDTDNSAAPTNPVRNAIYDAARRAINRTTTKLERGKDVSFEDEWEQFYAIMEPYLALQPGGDLESFKMWLDDVIATGNMGEPLQVVEDFMAGAEPAEVTT